MSRGILVPLDGSTLASRVVPYAEELAQACDADLLLAHAGGGESREVRRTIEPQLAALQDTCSARGLRARTIVEENRPAADLPAMASRFDVALVVMGTVGQSGLSRWVLGSMAEQMLRRLRVPVLLLTPTALEAGTAIRLHRRVVVPVDGSELSRQIYPVVRTLARRLHEPITLVRVLEADALLGIPPAEPPAASERELRQRIEGQILAGLQRRAMEWLATGLEVEAVVMSGGAAQAVLDVAANNEAGWLAMASHGLGGHGGLVLGSTALAILRRTTLPVLLAAVPKQEPYHVGAAS